MAEDIIGGNSGSFDQASLALVRELKHSLYQIARRAELGNHSLETIQKQAELSLRLIDSYILSSQTEYGQMKLDLEPMAIGSVMHEAALQARSISEIREVKVETKANRPVMSNKAALAGFLSSIAGAMGGMVATRGSSTLVMRSYVASNGDVGVGVFSKGNDLTASDLRTALQMSGSSQMAMARQGAGSGALLTIADSLARALGGTLEVKRMGTLRGFATVLPQSTQLSLV